jgi:hypothetical protein
MKYISVICVTSVQHIRALNTNAIPLEVYNYIFLRHMTNVLDVTGTRYVILSGNVLCAALSAV